jgi:hypothetical protein
MQRAQNAVSVPLLFIFPYMADLTPIYTTIFTHKTVYFESTILYSLNPSGNLYVPPVLTFSNSAFCLQSVFMGFV